MDGTHKLGGPVRVAGGVAIGPFTNLPPGQHSVTAVFTPAKPTAFQASTSSTVTLRF